MQSALTTYNAWQIEGLIYAWSIIYEEDIEMFTYLLITSEEGKVDINDLSQIRN